MGPRGRRAAATLSSRASRRGRARATRRRRLRVPARALSGLVAILSAAALGWVVLGDTPRIARVAVTGARHVAPAQAAVASGLEGQRVFEASASAARDRLRALAAVRDARVEISLPGGARVALVERSPVGRWIDSAGVEWLVDADGVLFASADPAAAPQLRVRDERAARAAGERIDPALVAAALRLAGVASGELRADATAPAVVVRRDASGLVLRFGSGWEIRFGGPERIEEKLAVVRGFLRDEPRRGLDYVDVRSPDRIVYSPQ